MKSIKLLDKTETFPEDFLNSYRSIVKKTFKAEIGSCFLYYKKLQSFKKMHCL